MSTPEKPLLRDFVFDREELIRQATRALDQVVARQSGSSGFAVRTVYRMARGLAPNMMHELMSELLEDFLDALTPFYHEALELDVPVDAYIESQRKRVAEAMLKVTDQRKTQRASSLKKGYDTLRPQALARVEDACPELGKLVHDNIPRELRPGARGFEASAAAY